MKDLIEYKSGHQTVLEETRINKGKRLSLERRYWETWQNRSF